MSKTETDGKQYLDISNGLKVGQGARIDSAHVHGDKVPEPIPESAPAHAEKAVAAKAALVESTGDSAVMQKVDLVDQQLQRQAGQLADYLRNRQKDIDRRESQLNAAIAQFESDVRTARMWISEQEAEQNQRSAELELREKESIKRIERLAAVDALLMRKIESTGGVGAAQNENHSQQFAKQVEALNEERRQWEIQRQKAENYLQHERQQLAAQHELSLQRIGQRELELQRQLEALQTQGVKSSSNPAVRAEYEKYQAALADLQARQMEMESAEEQIAIGRIEIQKIREQLAADRRRLHDDTHDERRRLIEQHRQTMDELDKKRRSLQLRSEHVDQCRSALLKLRAELQQMHRETLEIRLATEELWVKLSGSAPPAAMTHSLGQIRSRLADQYRLANSELLEQKKELEAIREQLAQQYEKVIEQRQKFEQSMVCREGDSDEQSSRLVAREQELLKQQTLFEQESQQWQVERLQYEQEIRRLRQKLSMQSELPACV